MENKSFDLGALLEKHKRKPLQFVSVAGGVKKRLERNLQLRKSTRLSVFDRVRNLPRCESPTPLTDAQLKVEHRRQQLEKWKEQKEKKKQEAAALKKKPFLTGVPHAPHKFVLPPPPPKAVPSTSGRVTRSQSARSNARIQKKESNSTVQSFAPKNASFRPPEIKKLTNLPHLATAKDKKDNRKITNITFEPVIHDIDRSKSQQQTVTDTKVLQKVSDRTIKSRITKPIPNKTRANRKPVQSSKKTEQNNAPSAVTKRNTRKSIMLSSPNRKTLRKSTKTETDSGTSSEEMPSSLNRKTYRKSTRTVTNYSQTSSEEISASDVSITKKNSRESVTDSSLPIVSQNTPRKLFQRDTTTSESSFENIALKTSKGTLNRKSLAGICSPMLTNNNPRKSLPKEPITSDSSVDSLKSKSPTPQTKNKSIVESSPIIGKNTSKKSTQKETIGKTKAKTPRKSLPNDVKYVTPKNSVPKSESSSEERLRSPKSLSDAPRTPDQIIEEAKKCSSCITVSRGKDNARREMKQKLAEGLLDEDASNGDSIDHFRRQLASEITRITEMCDTWDKIYEQTVLPDNVQEAVLGAVGQARLLMSQKLQQFAALIERCARPEPGTSLVTPADLAGFWDMVFMQVENIDVRFKNLEELQSRGWLEPPVEVKKKVVPKGVNSKKPAKAAGGPSRLREMIAAARKAKKEQEIGPPVPMAVAPDSKTFEAGFFCVRSPIKTSTTPCTPARNSLLKAVLSSEAKKASASKNSASFAMLRASVLGKNVECEGITLMPQTPINLHATPGRSILKPSTTKKSSKKSIKVVLFNQSDADDDSIDTEKENANSPLLKPSSNIEKGKENSRRRSRLVRQDAEDRSPVMTRSRRKSVNEGATPRRSDKKVLKEDNVL